MPLTHTHSSPWLLEFVIFQLPECHLMLFTTRDKLTTIERREAHRQNLIHVSLATNNNKSAFIIKYTIRKKTNTFAIHRCFHTNDWSKVKQVSRCNIQSLLYIYSVCKDISLSISPQFSLQKLFGACTYLSINVDRTLAEVIFFFRVQSHTVTVWYSLSSTDARYSPWLL